VLLLLIRYVTLWPSPLTFWSCLVSGHTWRVTWSIRPPSLKILWLSILELWVLTSPIGCHWQCVCSHCACAVSRDLCVGGKFFRHIWNPWPRFACSLHNFYGATMTSKGRLLLAPLMLKLWRSVKGFRGGGVKVCPSLLTLIIALTTLSHYRASVIKFLHLVYTLGNFRCPTVHRRPGVFLVMAALHSRCGHYIFAVWFLLLSSFFPRLISAVGDCMSTILPHMVWP